MNFKNKKSKKDISVLTATNASKPSIVGGFKFSKSTARDYNILIQKDYNHLWVKYFIYRSGCQLDLKVKPPVNPNDKNC